jgi:hypothetical protein
VMESRPRPSFVTTTLQREKNAGTSAGDLGRFFGVPTIGVVTGPLRTPACGSTPSDGHCRDICSLSASVEMTTSKYSV